MSWTEYLFSFKGRINRAKLWLFFLIVFLVEIAAFALFVGVFGTSALLAAGKPATSQLAGGVGGALFVIVYLVVGIALIVASLALTVKRLHDRDKGAAWLLVFWFLPFVLNVIASGVSHAGSPNPGSMTAVALICAVASVAISIWAFVELYCLRGTIGDNRFGSDPLAGRA